MTLRRRPARIAWWLQRKGCLIPLVAILATPMLMALATLRWLV